MTVSELVALARRCAASPDVSIADVRMLAEGVIGALAEPAPCGYELPEVWGQGISVPQSWRATVPPEDARSLGRMLLVAADERDRQVAELAAKAETTLR